MNKNIFYQITSLMNTLLKKITVVFIVLILILIGAMTGCETYSRITFHQHVKEAAKSEACQTENNECESNESTLFNDQNSVVEQQKQCDRSFNITPCSCNYNQSRCNHKKSELDILEKSNGLLNANGLTYCVTLIVALLATLLIYRLVEMEALVKEYDKNKKEINKHLNLTTKFESLLSLVRSNYDLAMMIENFTMTLPPQPQKQNVLVQIGNLRFRLNKNISLIKERQDNKNTRIDTLSEGQHQLLTTILEDTLMTLQKSEQRDSEVGYLISNTIVGIEWAIDFTNSLEILKDNKKLDRC